MAKKLRTPIEQLIWQCSNVDARYYIHLKLYPIINELTIDDWRIIRKGDYWEKRDAISCPFKKAGFTLARIEHYQRNYC